MEEYMYGLSDRHICAMSSRSLHAATFLFCVLYATLAKVLKAAPKGSATEPSSWTHEHITTSSEDARAATLRLMQAVV
jgi:hypothetical protein